MAHGYSTHKKSYDALMASKPAKDNTLYTKRGAHSSGPGDKKKKIVASQSAAEKKRPQARTTVEIYNDPKPPVSEGKYIPGTAKETTTTQSYLKPSAYKGKITGKGRNIGTGKDVQQQASYTSDKPLIKKKTTYTAGPGGLAVPVYSPATKKWDKPKGEVVTQQRKQKELRYTKLPRTKEKRKQFY